MTRTAHPRNDRVGLIPPGEMFDRPLPGGLILDTDLPFEERVARAWEHVKATRFLEEEKQDYSTRMIAKENIDD
jgi:hypothetical protein